MPTIKDPVEERPNPNTIVSLDPSTPLDPRPLIADILRTRYCVPGSVFLVESIDRRVLIPPHAHGRDGRDGHEGGVRRRAVRLLLGDGELCIQAFARGEIHGFVDGGSVYEGCYVRLDQFWLREGVRRVVYLIVGDMVTVGWNEEYLRILEREREEKVRQSNIREEGDIEQIHYEKDVVASAVEDGIREEGRAKVEEYEDDEDDEILEQLLAVEEGKPPNEPVADEASRARLPKPASEEGLVELDHICESESDSDSAFETLAVSAERASQRRITVPTPDPRQELQDAIVKQNQQHRHQNTNQNRPQSHLYQPQPQPQPQSLQQKPQPISNPRPWLPTDAAHLVKLTPLSQIPHLPYRQNWMVNVLAVVTSLSDVESSHIGPSFRQRTARLTDMSTPKQVHLTVYLHPEEFVPAEGSVVLLLGVKNHLFEGGSLRKYVSDGLSSGESWWVAEPGELGWCRAGVERLRAWWREKGQRGGEGSEKGFIS
ncbi:hypothetical protein C7999DRAFT_17796 [Corynascus novoguineensis]|uniref:Uncharacterized protein n=1 Tax=Corynascus novoguineensis TaxID=1126955 RepID=A0AAN7CMT1_9PEZI|nr:hypothetical protein C7999DRAFT_17796 [Corynascus novoguineensis]